MLKNQNIKLLERDLNPGPLASKARIIPLDHQAAVLQEIVVLILHTETP